MSRYDQCYFQKLLNDAMFVFVFSPIKLMAEVKMKKIWFYRNINYDMYVLKISSEL